MINNLEWVNLSENAIHAVTHNLIKWQTGEECSWSKITLQQANQIADLVTKGVPVKEIALIVGCQKSSVFNVKRGLAWRDVYYEYGLWRYKTRNINMFSDDAYLKIMNYIDSNFYKFVGTDYRGLCYDIMRELFGQKLTKSQYVELCDYIENYKVSKNIISPFKIITQLE